MHFAWESVLTFRTGHFLTFTATTMYPGGLVMDIKTGEWHDVIDAGTAVIRERRCCPYGVTVDELRHTGRKLSLAAKLPPVNFLSSGPECIKEAEELFSYIGTPMQVTGDYWLPLLNTADPNQGIIIPKDFMTNPPYGGGIDTEHPEVMRIAGEVLELLNDWIKALDRRAQ